MKGPDEQGGDVCQTPAGTESVKTMNDSDVGSDMNGSIRDENSVAAFTRRAQECSTQFELDRLHTLMCRTVPARERQPFIEAIEYRERVLMQIFDQEKRYL